MKVRKQRPAGEGGNGWNIVLEIGKRRYTSFFSNPDNSVDHAELEYFKGRYPMITTTARMEQFKRLYKNLWVIVTAGQYKLMQHMLGLDYKKKPFRNYGYFYKEQPDLEGLVNIGLATKRNGDKEGHVVYFLTKQGVEYVLRKSISDKVYKKL